MSSRRNATTRSAIDAAKLLPRDIISKGPSSADNDDAKCNYFLLQVSSDISFFEGSFEFISTLWVMTKHSSTHLILVVDSL